MKAEGYRLLEYPYLSGVWLKKTHFLDKFRRSGDKQGLSVDSNFNPKRHTLARFRMF